MSTSWDSEDSFWKRTVLYSAIGVALVAAGGAYYYFKVAKRDAEPAEAPPVAQAPVEPELPSAEREHHPVPSVAVPDKPLPKLRESDPEFRASLADVFGRKTIDQMLVPDMVIRRLVVTVDNMPRSKVPEQVRPVKALGGQTAVDTSADTITLSDENFARYADLVRLIQNTDSQQLGALYIRYYPLFQETYEELGYPGQYFNDRLVEVIDHLLQTPDVRGPIELKQGKVFYEYADPALEARSAGQKLLLRMGPQNAAVIKQKLRELRIVVTTSQDPPEDSAAGGVGAGAGATPAPGASDKPTVKPDAAPEAAPAAPSR